MIRNKLHDAIQNLPVMRTKLGGMSALNFDLLEAKHRGKGFLLHGRTHSILALGAALHTEK